MVCTFSLKYPNAHICHLGYYNYRHQADIAHSYQILHKLGGFPKENIIVMMYNDVVNASENPLPGQLFNEPGGVDVYGDINISYSGDEVTAENFLNVIKGKKHKEKRYPVLESGPNDNVFIYYSDHGATGLVAMPVGDPLYAKDLIEALNYMHEHGMYSQLVFYLEACESGSMFDGILSNTTNVFATTAATPDQPSYAYYYNDTLSTYMADEYSIRWMQDSTSNWDAYESLIDQFNDVAAIVNESQPQKVIVALCAYLRIFVFVFVLSMEMKCLMMRQLKILKHIKIERVIKCGRC